MVPNEQYWFQHVDFTEKYKKLYKELGEFLFSATEDEAVVDALDEDDLTVRTEAEYLDSIQTDLASLRYHIKLYLEDLCEESVDN